jgi:nitrogen fixation NifU-like protein
MLYAFKKKWQFYKFISVIKMIEKKFDFWRDHSLHYLEMAFRYDRRERMQNPDGYGKQTGECGDTVEMFLCIKNGRIQSVSFDTDGCINTNACANTVSHLSEGKTIEEAWEITPEDVIEFLETLPKENYHCAELVVGVFYLVLANCQECQRNSWKKPYQKG